MIRTRQSVRLSASLPRVTIGPLYGIRLERRDSFTGQVLVTTVGANGVRADAFTVPPDETGWITFPDGASRAELSTPSTQELSADVWWSSAPWDASLPHTPTIGRQLGVAYSDTAPGNPTIALSGVRVREIFAAFVNLSAGLNRNCFLDVLYDGTVQATLPLGAVGPATTSQRLVSLGHGATAAPVFAGFNTIAVPFAVPGDFRLRMDGALADNLAFVYAWGR